VRARGMKWALVWTPGGQDMMVGFQLLPEYRVPPPLIFLERAWNSEPRRVQESPTEKATNTDLVLTTAISKLSWLCSSLLERYHVDEGDRLSGFSYFWLIRSCLYC